MWDRLQPTQLDLKNYVIGDMLGEGAFGQVFRATRIASGETTAACAEVGPRYIAVKRIKKDGLSDQEIRDVINEVSGHGLGENEATVSRGEEPVICCWRPVDGSED